MGSRGSSGRGGRGGGGGGGTPFYVNEVNDLVSARERQQAEVDQVLTVGRDINEQFGENVNQWQIVGLDKRHADTVLAYCDGGDNIAFNKKFFDTKDMNGTYDDCVATGFHPSRGRKTGIEATAAHEMGHLLVQRAAQHAGISNDWDMASDIVLASKKSLGMKSWKDVGKAISGYAEKNYHETIAEALADVYCNGAKATRASRTVVGELVKRYPNANSKGIIPSNAYLGGDWS